MEPQENEIARALNELVASIEYQNGLSLFDWIAILGAPIVLAGSLGVAFYGVMQHRAMARKRATLDLIEKVESSDFYKKLHDTFERRKKTKTLSSLSNPKDSDDHTHRLQVFAFLNHYELVALGIRRKILDGEFYKGWMRTNFVNDWLAAEEFIQRERWKQTADKKGWEYQATLYEHYNCIANQWAPGDVKILKAENGSHPQYAEGPGDEPKAGIRDATVEEC